MPYKKNISQQVLNDEINKVLEMKAEYTRDYALDLYSPSQTLLDKLDEFFDSDNDESGVLLEQIAFLALLSVKCFDIPKSYRSESAQFDAIVSGNSVFMNDLMENLHLSKSRRTIVIEAKDRKDPITTEQFFRLCGIVDIHFDTTCDLGIFFSRHGASGFPNKKRRNVKCLRDSRAVQALFHANTGKFVIVLDANDLNRLRDQGGLLILIREKIEEVERRTGKYAQAKLQNVKISIDGLDLPRHLKQLLSSTATDHS